MRRSRGRIAAVLLVAAVVQLGCTGTAVADYQQSGGGVGKPKSFGGDADQSYAYGDSVRMLTFNVQFLPDSDDDVTRSKLIAQRIKAVDYEVVVLNEVFDEEARRVLVGQLGDEFPNYVSYLGDDAVGSQDSGLMLFSKFPFVDLPADTYRAEEDDVKARNQGANWKDVAFIEYDDDVFPDNWAAKGVGFVRIKNPATGRFYNVAFTHMQASYPEDEEDHEDWYAPIGARIGQLKDVRKVIEGSLLPGMLEKDEVVLLGDLNIDGDLADADVGDGCCGPNLWEWNKHFNSPGGFFTDTLKDSWANEQTPDDRGLTNLYHWGLDWAGGGGARLDYVVRNRATRGLCAQHLTLAHNMRGGTPTIESGFGQAGPSEYSDHIGINADLNRAAPRCSPRTALASPMQDQWINGSITYPGSVQWYRFDKPGTYAFAVKGDGIDYRVYSGKDMSTPMPQYYDETINFKTVRGEPVEGKKYAFPDPPYYVKVFNTSREATGPYQLIAHRANCRSMEEACVLRASDPIEHTLPAAPVNADDTNWFEFHTEAADSGQAQTLGVKADDYTPDTLELRLLADDGSTVISEDVESQADPNHSGKRLLTAAVSAIGPAKHYLTVKRTDLAVGSFGVGWETNLTILHGQTVGIPGAAQARRSRGRSVGVPREWHTDLSVPAWQMPQT